MANPVGRPTKYKTREDLIEIVNQYFNECDEHTKEVYSPKLDEVLTVKDPLPYTMSGLGRRLNLSRQALMEYKNSEKFGDIIKEARQAVEEYYESHLTMGTSAVGSIFNLKCNFSWRDNLDESGKPQANPIYFVNQVPTQGEPEDDK